LYHARVKRRLLSLFCILAKSFRDHPIVATAASITAISALSDELFRGSIVGTVSLCAGLLALAMQAKRLAPRAKYRNMEITKSGISANWQTAGSMT
jgi:hypothetical protein